MNFSRSKRILDGIKTTFKSTIIGFEPPEYPAK